MSWIDILKIQVGRSKTAISEIPDIPHENECCQEAINSYTQQFERHDTYTLDECDDLRIEIDTISKIKSHGNYAQGLRYWATHVIRVWIDCEDITLKEWDEEIK